VKTTQDEFGFTYAEAYNGEPAPCCGCPIVRADNTRERTWLDCDCRCHESAKALYRATVVHQAVTQ